MWFGESEWSKMRCWSLGRDPFQTPLGELTALHRPPSWTKEKGGENEGSEGREEGDEDSKGGKEVEEG